MLSELNLPTLQGRRSRAKLQMIHKIINDPVAIPIDCLTPAAPSYLRNGHFNQLNTNVDSFKVSFFPSTIKLWSHLPTNITEFTTYTKFIIGLDNYTCAL